MRAIWENRMRAVVVAALAAGMALAGCNSASTYTKEASLNDETVLSATGSTAPEGQRRQFAATGQAAEGGNAIRINGFLWRAALDTLSFMPITTADPYGGAILTDWYSPQGADNERFKLNVLIQGTQIRSDGVRVTVFKQERAGDGTWQDASTNNDTALDLENLILVRARDLRQASLNE